MVIIMVMKSIAVAPPTPIITVYFRASGATRR